MKRQPRLSRSEVLARFRAHAARHGGVSPASLHAHDRIVLRSLLLHFPSFEAARRAAHVPAAAPRRRARGRRGRGALWSRRRVLDELRRIDRAGRSTMWADLMQAGRGDLLVAASIYAGGLRQARTAAGLRGGARRPPIRRWHKAAIAAAIKQRARKGQPLASSKAPPHFVAAARWHFGSWEAALAAAGVDAQEVRLQRRPYTRPYVIALLRRLAREGTALRASALKRLIKLDTVRKLFGSLEGAMRAAGLVVATTHANQKWSRARVVEQLRARAKQGKLTLTRALHGAVQLYFGGVHAARDAAGLAALQRAPWTRASLIDELQQRARRGDSGSTLWSACTRLFGSIAAARRAAGVPATGRASGMRTWGKAELLTELRRRTRKRQQLGRGLTEGIRREFGSLAEARIQAGVARRGTASGAAWRRWSRERVLSKLQALSAGKQRLRGDLYLACKHRFGSLEKACAAAGVPVLGMAWSKDRILRALRDPGFGALDPAFVAACVHHFGSVTAARAAARAPQRRWSKATVIAELQARARRGLPGVGRLLREPAVRLFGSTEAALRAAARRTDRSAL
jgi:hypothetical protein